jgi:hypothetical protein
MPIQGRGKPKARASAVKGKPEEKSENARPLSERQALARKALALVRRRIEEGDMKLSVADLVRLLEIADEERGKGGSRVVIEARWVDPKSVSPGTSPTSP